MRTTFIKGLTGVVCLLVLITSTPVASKDLLVSARFSDNVLRFDGTTGLFKSVFASGGGLNNAIGMDWGPDGNLYVASGDVPKVFRYNGVTGTIIDVFVFDDPNTVGDETGNLVRPRGLMFGPDGNLYVASGGSNRVNAYDGQTGAFLRVAASGGSLSGPIGLAFDTAGDLYVAGGLTGLVHKYDGNTGAFIKIFASIPNRQNATGLLFGPNGNLFVGSGANRAVYEFDGVGGGLVKVFASGNGLTAVIGVAFDEQGLLYVSSFSSNSVLRFDAHGSFVDQFVSPGAGGLSGTHFFLFIDGPVATQRTSFGEFKEQFRP